MIKSLAKSVLCASMVCIGMGAAMGVGTATPSGSDVLQEDETGYNCTTMGNSQCGPTAPSDMVRKPAHCTVRTFYNGIKVVQLYLQSDNASLCRELPSAHKPIPWGTMGFDNGARFLNPQ
jgi:hypothetical protein